MNANPWDTRLDPRFCLLFVLLHSCLLLPQIAAICVVLPLHWPGTCDSPLLAWCVGWGWRLLCKQLVFLLRLCRLPPLPDSARKFLEGAQVATRLAMFAWFLFGLAWFFSSETCVRLQPEVWKLTLALILIHVLSGLLPLLLLSILVPISGFCIPVLMTLIQVVSTQYGFLQPSGAAAREINSLPTMVWTGTEPDEACPICLSPYVQDQELRVLQCGGQGADEHRFHKACIDQWLRLNAICPLCRMSVRGLRPATYGAAYI